MLALLPALGPEQRFERIVNRPEAAYMLRSLEPTFGCLPPDFCNTQLVSAVSGGGIGHLRAALWVLSFQDFELSDTGREALLSCVRHEDQVVRTCAFQLVAHSRDSSVLASIRRGNWAFSQASPSNSPEDFYGSKALSLSAKPGDYAALRARITPELWGFLADQDGSEAAIDAFADDLDLLLRASLPKNVTDLAQDPRITLTLDPAASTGLQLSRIDPFLDGDDLRPDRASFSPRSTMASVDHLRQLLDPDAFDRRAREAVTSVETLYERARQDGVAMFGTHFRGDSLPEVIRRRPELVASWVAMLEGESTKEVIWRAGDFYRALALSLAPIDPGRAAGIIRRLLTSRQSTRVVVAPMKIDALTYAAWEIPECPDARELRADTLDSTLSDKGLLEIVLVAQHLGAEDNLIRAIEYDATSGILVLEARALTLVGWLDEGPALDRLQLLLDHRRGYLDEVAQTARERLRRNRIAKSWFNEFLCRREEETAWAAFRMALRCVDRRFYLWSLRMTDAVGDLPDRWRLSLAAAESDIANAIDRNERGLEDLLFGTRIGSSKILAPWGRV